MRKPVFGVSNQVGYKTGCTATEDGSVAKTKGADQLHGYAYAKSRFSHDAAHIALTYCLYKQVCCYKFCQCKLWPFHYKNKIASLLLIAKKNVSCYVQVT